MIKNMNHCKTNIYTIADCLVKIEITSHIQAQQVSLPKKYAIPTFTSIAKLTTGSLISIPDHQEIASKSPVNDSADK